ncbi:MAG: hypothetical protein AAGC53_05755 [Actinomycetota bacterium]
MSSKTKVGGWGTAWIVGVVAYAVLRALIVWPTLGEYNVSPVIFLIIDVGTAWPYAYGQVRVVQEARAGNWRSVQLWAVVAFVNFIAPYAYIVGAGSGEMPLFAWIVIGVLVVFFGVASVIRILRQIRAPEPEPVS